MIWSHELWKLLVISPYVVDHILQVLSWALRLKNIFKMIFRVRHVFMMYICSRAKISKYYKIIFKYFKIFLAL